LKDGFATGTTGATTERREWREQTPPIALKEGEARRRGGGTIYVTATPPPEVRITRRMRGPGWVTTLSSPRCFFDNADDRAALMIQENCGEVQSNFVFSVFFFELQR